MLGHLKVVDLTCGLGGYAGVMLAELGAAVTLVEWCPPQGDAAEVAMDRRGKRVVALDLEGARELVAGADILLRGPEAFEADVGTHPALIDVAILAFEPGRANAARHATDLTLMARSGLVAIGGDPDRAPLNLPGRQAWALAGIQGAIAALTALHARAASGAGQRVQVYAYRSAVLANYREPLTWGWTGRIGARTGNLLVRGKSGVRQIWQAADGHVTWALVDNPPMMRAFVAQMGAMAGELAQVDWDAILVADMPQETLRRWEGLVAAWLATMSRTELTRLSNAHGMGLSAIDGVGDVLASEHLAARGLWRDAEIDGHAVKLPGPLFLRSPA
ncbi:CoA transferase [Sphingomonas sp.]|uniref:CoA transferase n=1 Tax=Sphingomonas sp. TaxID=28214 RepID=UPI0025FD7C4F|nr:CoA transferase [Sphingomonas sp.]